MKNLLLSLSLILITSVTVGQGGNWQWARTATQPDSQPSAWAECVATDHHHNIIVAGGYATNSIIFGSTTLYNPNPAADSNFGQIYLVKFDSSGNVLWALSGTGIGNQVVYRIATDNNDNIYLAGQFGSFPFVFGHDTLFQTPNVSAPGFVVKFNAAGNVLWAKNLDGDQGGSGIFQIVTDPADNVYMTGTFYSDSIVFGSATLYDSSHNTNNAFFIKCDSTGNVIWAKSSAWGYGQGIAFDPAGNILFSGVFSYPPYSNHITFGPYELVTLPGGGINAFLTKFDPNGNALWAKNIGTRGLSYDYLPLISNNLTTDAWGNTYVSGSFNSPLVTMGTDTLYGDTHEDHYFFIEKYDTGGNVLWARGATSPAFGAALATDTGGDVYVTGNYTAGSISFGNGVLYNRDSASSQSHIFITKYDKNGYAFWDTTLGGDEYDNSSDAAVDNGGNLYLAGSFSSDSIAFGTHELYNAGQQSVNPFVAKYSPGLPELYLTSAKTTICPGDSVLICANAGFASYKWNRGDTGRCIEVTGADNYNVTAYNTIDSITSSQLSIAVFPIGQVEISRYGDTLISYIAESYQWQLDGQSLTGDTSAMLIAQHSGNYVVVVTDSNGCEATSSAVFISTSIFNIQSDGNAKIFPNPSDEGEWALAVSPALIGSSIEVYDMEGKVIYSTSIKDLETQLNLSVSSGVYLLRIANGSNYIFIRLVKI